MNRQDLLSIPIEPIDAKLYGKAKGCWDKLSKPLDGLGEFEEWICQIAAILGNTEPDLSERVLLVYCADNGIVEEGVTQSEQEITKQVAMALGQGTSSANCLAKPVHTKVLPVDIGICCEEKIEGVLDRKVAKGTKNFRKEAAMSEEELMQAIETGIKLVEEQKKAGAKLIATGEMGIGNTTTSAAVLAAILGIDSEKIVGRGAGLNDEKLNRKRQLVRQGIEQYQSIIDKTPNEAERCLEILRCLGGLDIAAMCGTFIGGALHRVPILVDGVISATAALLAERIRPGVKEYMLASHAGRERGTMLVLQELGKKPAILGDMALGEGTGALMMIGLLDQALFFYRNGSRFTENGIADYERFGA